MPKYALKILLDFEAGDDLAARQRAAAVVASMQGHLEGVRDIILHSQTDHKSIRMAADGSFQGQWNRGGPSTPPGEVKTRA